MPTEVAWTDDELNRGRLPLDRVRPGDRVAARPTARATTPLVGTVREVAPQAGLWVDAQVEDARGAYRDTVFIRPEDVFLRFRVADLRTGLHRTARAALQSQGVAALRPVNARLAGASPTAWHEALLAEGLLGSLRESERVLRWAAQRTGLTEASLWEPALARAALDEVIEALDPAVRVAADGLAAVAHPDSPVWKTLASLSRTGALRGH